MRVDVDMSYGRSEIMTGSACYFKIDTPKGSLVITMLQPLYSGRDCLKWQAARLRNNRTPEEREYVLWMRERTILAMKISVINTLEQLRQSAQT